MRRVPPIPPRPSPVALVTGGAQGIGRGLARRLLADGWRVLIVDRDVRGLAHARHEFADTAVCRLLRGDCGRPATARRAVDLVGRAFGRLDLLVNNAGGSGFAPLARQTPAGWRAALDANLSSTFFFSQAAAEALAAAQGAIVNIASTRALQSEPGAEAYAAAKGGVVALTHALAASLAGRVRVNCICPGWIDVSGSQWGPGRRRAPPGGTLRRRPCPALVRPGRHPGRHRRGGAAPRLRRLHHRPGAGGRRRHDPDDALPLIRRSRSLRAPRR